jgi:MazG family protein
MSSAGDEFTRLVEIMARLRAPGGCPWDREQTLDTLKKYVLEETYELLEAMDRHDHEAVLEELGDFVLEAVFVAELESEAGRFSIADALQAVSDKLVRRHPHIFQRDAGEPALHTAAQVRTRWEEIKTAERGRAADGGATDGGAAKTKTLLSGIPATLPSLLRTYQVGSRAASVGFDWERAADVVAKMREEVDEVDEVLGAAEALDTDRLEEEIGDLLFAIANLSRKLRIEPEAALRKANDKFTRRFTAMETRIAEAGRKMTDMTLDELETEWQTVKSNER